MKASTLTQKYNMIKVIIIITMVITSNHSMHTTYIFSRYSYHVGSEHFTEEETRAQTRETNLPMVSQLINGRARFQALMFAGSVHSTQSPSGSSCP